MLYQTIMSTDIVKFQDNGEIYQEAALKLYLKITLPLMAITFIGWWGVYQLARWGVKNKVEEEAEKV